MWGGRGGIDDLPLVGLEDRALCVGQPAFRVVDDETGAQGHEGRVDVDWIRVAGKVDGVHPVIRKVALQPLHAPAVRGQPVLAEEVLADAQDVGRVEQRLVLGGDEVERGGAIQAFLDGDLVEVAGLVGGAGEPRPRGPAPIETPDSSSK